MEIAENFDIIQSLKWIQGLMSVSVGTILIGITGAFWYMFRSLFEHKRKALFDTSVSKIYNELKEYVISANKFKDNVQSIPSEYITNKNMKAMDEWITFPLQDFINRTLMLEMFFKKKDRGCLQKMMEVSVNYNYKLRQILLEYKHKDDMKPEDKLEIKYGTIKTEFLIEFRKSMNEFVDMINELLLGKWQGSF